MNNIKIAFITTHFPPSTGFGGVCESSYGLARALSNVGSHIEVVTSDATTGGRVSPAEFAHIKQKSLSIHPFRYCLNNRLCFSLNAKHIILNVLRSCDIAHINGIYTYPVTIGARFARRLKKPYIIAIRGGLEPWVYKQKHLKKRVFFSTILKPLLRDADCIHVTSEGEMQSCIALGLKGPFTIIPNGINPDDFAHLPGPTEAKEVWPRLKGKKLILFLSRLAKEKGLDMLLDVWFRITQKHPHALLVIAGPDDRGYQKHICKIIQRGKLSQSVFILGNITGHKKLMLYSGSDIFILPSYSENFGNVVAEALACGIPVITTEGAPWKDIDLFDCGKWVPVQAEAIEEALCSLLKMPPAMLAEMGQRGRSLICKNYTWDVAARRMKNVYNCILEKKEIPLHPEP